MSTTSPYELTEDEFTILRTARHNLAAISMLACGHRPMQIGITPEELHSLFEGPLSALTGIVDRLEKSELACG